MRLETPGTRGWFRPPHLGQAHGAFKPCTAHFAAWPVPFRNADPLTLFNQHERATELRRRRPMADERYEQRQRSEEHTSELQSLMRISYAVFCLKQQNKNIRHNQYNM